MEIRGIDVSEHDGVIDWERVKADGVTFAMIRAGYGSSTANRDLCFAANMDGALAAGIDVGCYWFSYAYTVEMAQNEARVLLEVIAPYRGRILYPLSFDWEYDSERYARQNGVDPSNALITDMALAFLEAIQISGWYAMNYTNLDFYYNRFQTDRLASFDLWLADYNSGAPAVPCGIQQTGDNGSISGVSAANVDTDLAYRDYPALIRERGLNGYKKEPENGGEEDPEVIYNHIDDVPDWARPTIEVLVEKGYLKGDADGNLALNETMLRLLVINDRAGLYS